MKSSTLSLRAVLMASALTALATVAVLAAGTADADTRHDSQHAAGSPSPTNLATTPPRR